jgi:hypothetical protein
MSENDLDKYCREHGVPTARVGELLRVMDLTQLPAHMRETFDDRGFFKSEPVEVLAEATEVDESAEAEDAEETEASDTSPTKKTRARKK